MTIRFMSLALAAFLAVLVSGAASAGDGKVQYDDLREAPQNAIEVAPIVASKDRTVIIAYGGSDEVLRAVYNAAGEIEKATNEDIFFLQAPDRDADPNVTEFAIYMRGEHIGSLISDGNNLQKDQVLSEITTAIEKGLERLKAAQQ